VSTHRRVLTVLGLTLAVTVGGASLPASADFADSAAVPTTTIATGTVAAPAWVSITDSCATTTTTVRRTVHTDPVTGVQTQTAYSSTSNTVPSSTNVNYYSSVPVAGPGLNETTTTTVTQNTMLSVTATWAASTTSRGLSGYLANAHLGDGSVFPMAQTAVGVHTTSATVDADYLAYQPRLSVTTLTSYGWTASTAPTPVLSC
jgi:hypothetical protein